MAWIEGPHVKGKRRSLNDELEEVVGTLSDQEAQLWFGKYCLANPTFAVQLLTGVELDPVQDLMLRAFFLKDFCLCIAGRGFSKSFVIALFCILASIANPGVKIGVSAGTFRQSKACMKQIEAFASHPKKGRFLRSCITKELSKSSDAWELGISGSSIIAIPLGKVRGYRFNILIVDELLVVSKDILDSVLKPFLMVRQDGPLHDEIMNAQKLLVDHGKMKPEDVERFYSNNKIIGLSSASYKFESLYRDNYLPYVKTILDPNSKEVNHVVFRLSYRVAPKSYVDLSAVEEMRRTMSNSMFNRELEAIFQDDSGGYFSAQTMEEATIKLGDHPTVKVVGDPNKKYILAIDPNYSNSEVSDDFAMAVVELDEENESGILVHCYALPNSTNEKRCFYLKYLLENFNIVYICADNSGTPAFIEMTKDFKMLPRPLELFDHDFLNFDSLKGMAYTKEQFNPSIGKIVHSQSFGVDNWLRISNENLQWMIEKKKIVFASRVVHDSDFSRMFSTNFPVESLHYSRIQNSTGSLEKKDITKSVEEELKYEFVEHLGDMIDLTKKETSMIELSVSTNGAHQYDLPATMRKDNNPKRCRRDSYTVLLLACWGMKCWQDLNKQTKTPSWIFLPQMFG